MLEYLWHWSCDSEIIIFFILNFFSFTESDVMSEERPELSAKMTDF